MNPRTENWFWTSGSWKPETSFGQWHPVLQSLAEAATMWQVMSIRCISIEIPNNYAGRTGIAQWKVGTPRQSILSWQTAKCYCAHPARQHLVYKVKLPITAPRHLFNRLSVHKWPLWSKKREYLHLYMPNSSVLQDDCATVHKTKLAYSLRMLRLYNVKFINVKT